MKPLSKLEAQLQSIAEELGQREVHLAQLGSYLRQTLPKFSSADYGCATLTDLLGLCATVGRLRFGNRAEDRWFVFNSDDALDSGAPPVPVDDSVKSVRIAKAVWDGCVDVDGAGAWLDLQSAQLQTNPTTIMDEPERYIKLPHFDRARQVALLEEFLARIDDAHEPSVVATATAQWNTTKSPYSQLLKMLQEHDLDRRWLADLRSTVERELRAWASKHGVPPNTLFERLRQQRSSAAGVRAPLALVHPLDEPELRAFLKSAVDAMTLAELSQWSVPARLLLK